MRQPRKPKVKGLKLSERTVAEMMPRTVPTMVGINEESLMVELPPVPEWFRKELAQIATRDGRPMFKIVDGQRELTYRNGKTDVKHLLQSDGVPCYVPVVTQVFRRWNWQTRQFHKYRSRAAAAADATPGLQSLDRMQFTNHITVRGVGRPCWIIEVYVSPSEIGFDDWQKMRYDYLPVKGVMQKVDLLGEYPREGKYIYCLSVLNEQGEAISPHQGYIDELKKRWLVVLDDSRSLEQSIVDHQDSLAEFEFKQHRRLTENFYQFHGIAARRLHNAEISRPIRMPQQPKQKEPLIQIAQS